MILNTLNNMGKYSEVDVTWASIEKKYDYDKVTWNTLNNGIPTYSLFDADGNKIKIEI